MAELRRGRPKGNGNPQNLTPFNTMDPVKKRKIQSMGGKASAKAHQKRKAFKEALLLALEQIENGETTQDIGIASLMDKYKAGDLKAFEIVLDTVGEKPTDKQEVKIIDTDWFVE